jgi:hypothetical protein
MGAGEQPKLLGVGMGLKAFPLESVSWGSTMAAMPEEFSAAAPIAMPSARKVTVPVGMPPDAEESFAEMVRGWNCGREAGERVTTAVALPVVTVMLRAGAVLLP